MSSVRSPVVDLVLGARPNFVKGAAILHALRPEGASPPPLFRLICTGQHRDVLMSDVFFDQLSLPPPDVYLGASGSSTSLTAEIIAAYGRLLDTTPPDLVVVTGDVTSTMAAAVAAKQKGLPLAHVEAGLRSHDRTMPEEINRLITDSISDVFFTTSKSAGANLMAEGVPAHQIHFVGNTMVDTLLANLGHSTPPEFWFEYNLMAEHYILATLHRPSNVDDPARLEGLLLALSAAARLLPVVLPLHPRTARMVAGIASTPKNLCFVPPQSYLQFLYLTRHAKAIVTDSGGLSEEATVLGVPCITLRDSTERPETVTTGTNELAGRDPSALAPLLDQVFAGEWKKGSIPERWDGRSGERIIEVICNSV